MTSDQDRQQALEGTLARTQGQGPKQQAEAVNAYLMTEPSQTAADKLWTILVIGLVSLLVITVIGFFVAVLSDHYKDVILTVFTGLLGALIGLFVKTPTSGGGGG